MTTQPISQAAQTAPRDTSGQHPPEVSPGASGQRDYSHIQGWGADLDHKNRPAYPMERTPPRLEGVHWDRPEDQPLRMKVYHSTERPGVTPVFGTSTPPSGLSGMLRSVAYKLSENDVRHWLLLMFADRINVVEGLFDDLIHGRVPNVFSEMGAKAEFRHNPAGFARKTLFLTGVVAGTAYLFRRRRAKPSWTRSAVHALEDIGHDLRHVRVPSLPSQREIRKTVAQHPVASAGTTALLLSALIGGAYYLYRQRTRDPWGE